MSKLTAAQVLEQVDTLLPNTCSREQKKHWLHQAESFLVSLEGGAAPRRPMDDGEILSVEAPYDELYRHYVEAQIHYAAGETERCSNAMAMWNSLLLRYRDHCLRHQTVGGAAALKLC